MTGRELDPRMVAKTMRAALREVCRENGLVFHPDESFDSGQYYRFAPESVVAIHNHKRGAGAGVWFRLADRRVFDKAGAPADRDPALYDAGGD